MDNQYPRHADTLQIDDYPLHWQSTLLGEDFWRDTEKSNKAIHDRLDEEYSLALHTRFPFNMQTDSSSRNESNSTDEVSASDRARRPRRSRRLSMSESLGLRGRSAFDFGRKRRSESQASKMSSDNHSKRHRSRPAFRRLFGWKEKDPETDRHKAQDQEIQKQSEPRKTPSPLDENQATPAQPFMEFPGGSAWSLISRDRQSLGLDVFQPMHAHQRTHVALPLDELRPLGQFRHLRVLKVVGMLQSYQKHIWLAAWLNPFLEELELDMALAPRVRPKNAGKWPYIKGGWRLPHTQYDDPVYSGYQGGGSLHYDMGMGEYLDKQAMEKAKVSAMALGRTRNRLSIRTLTLSRFVVDGDPFVLWFDPRRLKVINFKEDCVDAGFYLPAAMRKVAVLYPRPGVVDRTVMVHKVDVKARLRLAQLADGKEVTKLSYHGREMLNTDQPGKESRSKKGNWYDDGDKEDEDEDETSGQRGSFEWTLNKNRGFHLPLGNQ